MTEDERDTIIKSVILEHDVAIISGGFYVSLEAANMIADQAYQAALGAVLHKIDTEDDWAHKLRPWLTQVIAEGKRPANSLLTPGDENKDKSDIYSNN